MFLKDEWVPGKIVNDVLFGQREHLFLAQGAHRVLDRVSGGILISKQAFVNFRDNIYARKRTCEERKKAYFHVVFPDKQTTLREEWPFENCASASRSFDAEIGTADDTIIYLHYVLSGHSDMYKKTDTHLTDKGTIVATCHLLNRLRIQDVDRISAGLLSRLTTTRTDIGDLGSKLEPAIGAEELYFAGGLKAKRFSNFLRGNNGVVDIYIAREPVANQRVLFFGDSFGRDMCQFLGGFFSEVAFLRTPFFHEEIFAMMDPDIVITENVERYLPQTTKDDERESFFMYPHFRNIDYRPDGEFAQAFSALLSFPRPPYLRFMEKMRSGG